MTKQPCPGDMVVKGFKRHSCFDWCGQRIIGIHDNQRLTKPDWNPTAVLELRCRRPLLSGPGYTLVCQHGRYYFVRQIAA